ncbi:hypothetical protein AWH69_14650 [Janibacter melonis]|uniref:DUF559 domain-containing protein n=1 Tax=Janibacter melonis TaxID=262209 RepID=A0A176QA37_9MICO|nr:hypothetical protein [Janibacter melonis]OAB86550.1 hypothetical protein AWH69_14650 [Janibacter melonis]
MTIWTRTQLLATGLTRRDLDAAVADGRLLVAGRWIADVGESPQVLSVLRQGARPTCVTAAATHGLWVPPHSGLHVMTRRPSAGTRWPGDYVTHGFVRRWPERSPVASVPLLLEHSLRCLDPLDVGVLVDSALHLGLVAPADVAALARAAPRRVLPVLARTTGRSESGTESKVRLFVALKGVDVRPQVQIPGVGRVDLLVGRRWIVEADSRAHHTGELAYETDRGRDVAALERGYLTSRLTYAMVFGEWARTSRWLISMIRTGQHLLDPGRSRGRLLE